MLSIVRPNPSEAYVLTSQEVVVGMDESSRRDFHIFVRWAEPAKNEHGLG